MWGTGYAYCPADYCAITYHYSQAHTDAYNCLHSDSYGACSRANGNAYTNIAYTCARFYAQFVGEIHASQVGGICSNSL